MSRSSMTASSPGEVLLAGFVGYLRGERGVAALTVDACVSDVRRFLAHRGESDLSAAALPVSGRRRSLLPQGISDEQARALLRACDRRRATGRRDYAVIVLMLRLGLRAGGGRGAAL